MEATLRTEFGQDPAHASAIELIFNLPTVDGRHVQVIGSSDERFVLHGGSGTLVEALVPPLLPYVATGHVLQSLRRDGDHVRLHFENGQVIEAERVIVTVPAPLLRTIDFGGLLPPLWQQYVTEIDCGRNEKVNAAYHGKPWASSMGGSGDVWPLAGGFAEGWDATTVEGDIGLMTFFMGGAQCAAAAKRDAATLRREFESAAAPAVPGLTQAATIWQRRTNWTNDRFSRGAYSCWKPGQLTRYARLFWLENSGKATQSPIVGPLVFAGEHLSDAWPGYMNGGAQTGRLAALAVLGA
jgi:monoamine oxidase